MLSLLLLLAAPGDATGTWRTPRGAQIALAPCGASLCGRIVSLQPLPGNPRQLDVRNSDAKLRTRPLKGLTMLSGFTGGPPRWTGGKVYNPEDGRTYSGRIELVDANTLKLTGCALAVFCRSQSWTRVR